VREHLLRFCRESLPPKLVPREIEMLPALPKNAAGKTAKIVLKEHN
jgi:acyl-coenzyme A synthetase/AMP-(fatty) acid ligase